MISAQHLRAVTDEATRTAEAVRVARDLAVAKAAKEADEQAQREAVVRAQTILSLMDGRLLLAARTGQSEAWVMTMMTIEYIRPEDDFNGFNRSHLRYAALIVFDALTAAGHTVSVKSNYDPPSGYTDNNLIVTW